MSPLSVPETLRTFIFLVESSKAALTFVSDFLSTARIVFLDFVVTKCGDAFAQPRIPMYSRIVCSISFFEEASIKRYLRFIFAEGFIFRVIARNGGVDI